MSLPSIVTDINGSREIIVEGVNGTIIPAEGTLPEAAMTNAYSERNCLLHIILDNGTTRIDGVRSNAVVHQSGTRLVDEMDRMEDDWLHLISDINHTIAHSTSIDTMALLGRIDSFAVSVLSAHPSDFLGSIAANDYSADVSYMMPQRGLELIDMLDPDDRDLVLMYIDKKSTRQIADLLGIKPHNVRRRLAKIRDRLCHLNSTVDDDYDDYEL